MRSYLMVALVMIAGVCLGQQTKKSSTAKKTKAYKIANAYKGADPYLGKPFHAGDERTMELSIFVGNIKINNQVTYRLLPDTAGRSYQAHHTYGAYIIKVLPLDNTNAIPKALTEAFKYRVIDLTEDQVMSDQVTASKIDYFFTVDDFNMDGKPDFAFIGDKRYHAYPVKNYVWVNIGGRLVYWYGLSNVSSDKENKATRMLSVIVTTKSGNYIPKYYNVIRDTTLIPFKHGL